ncbi:hypothetical protein [Andreprevotia chitinilytica]|uniref:hypothetical protein n=1 Tax=Andreprevotia chitinilytica TaxID=396808 RepID=UPI0005508320|nr:hypothetical protein [Andreprevotia chitinilytica]
MTWLTKGVAAVFCLCAVTVFAEDAKPVSKPAIYKGERGLAPVPVVYDYLKDRIADERGFGDYKSLTINQVATSDDGEHVRVEVVMNGLQDDSVASQRYQLGMSVGDNGWEIDSARQDWKCKRGGKGWTQWPCK